MIIKKVVIDNFKSIDHIELDFDKVGNSYTKIFVGLNESGKSNILEALSFFEDSDKKVLFDQYCNQKFEDKEECSIEFQLAMEENDDYYIQFMEQIDAVEGFHFTITNIVKRVYLLEKSDTFVPEYSFDTEIPEGYYIVRRKVNNTNGTKIIEQRIIVDELPNGDECEQLTKDSFEDVFFDELMDLIYVNEPSVSVWKPSPEYLLSNVDLNKYKTNTDSNKPLRNIFKLSGYSDSKSIVEAINKVAIPKHRSKLIGKLNDSINDYISKVWSNSIEIVIEITETGGFSFLIKDKGNENKYDRFSITDRSQGAQQFLSLILSLSLETINHERRNELILIDEPEVHLHPSGIRDLAQELYKIGEENYVFLATHSPFMIDKKHKERHFIVKKDKRAITELIRIKESDNLIDDEVLRDAFGIDVYKDLLNPHSILVEGASDKIVLQKAFDALGYKGVGITNGHGNNIVTLASKLNYDRLSVMVLLDDDNDGRENKKKIKKIGGVYSDDNVFTIRDLVGEIVDQGTIEDALDVSFVKSQFIQYYNTAFGESLTDIDLIPSQPVIKQISEFLRGKKKYSKWDMDAFKKQMSDCFKPAKSSFSTSNRLLKVLIEEVEKRLK